MPCWHLQGDNFLRALRRCRSQTDGSYTKYTFMPTCGDGWDVHVLLGYVH